MTSVSYKGCSFSRTETTTDISRSAFGRTYRAIGNVWGVSGRIQKNAMARPFLTSASQCRDYVREQDTIAEMPHA